MAALAASAGPIPHIGFSYCYPHNGMPPMNGFKAPSPTSSSSASASGNASPTHHEQNHREKLSETNLYIRGLSADTTDAKLHQMCERFGKIVSTKAIIDNETTKCKGYGFVDFELPEAAQKAVQKLTSEGHLVQMAKKQEEDPTNIYFSNLPDWIGDKALREMLEPYGEVVSTRILRHPGQNGSEGRSKGVGFARMHLKEQCEKIIEKFNGQPLTDPNNINKSTVSTLKS
jgi:RNA recognition motif-containing protein